MERFDLDGVFVEDPHGRFSRAVIRALRNNNYERLERRAVEAVLRPSDRVIEIGGGCGAVSAAAARIVGAGAVTSIEANPQMIPSIRHVHEINGVGGIRVINGLAAGAAGDAVFYVSEDFWASSLSPDTPRIAAEERIEKIDINALIAETGANALISDIEGAEFDLIHEIDLAPIDVAIVELHPAAATPAAIARFFDRVIGAGLYPDIVNTMRPRVMVFQRPERG